MFNILLIAVAAVLILYGSYSEKPTAENVAVLGLVILFLAAMAYNFGYYFGSHFIWEV